jgi:aspartate aminotransferase
MRAMRMVAGELWSSPTAPVQYAAAVAYGGDPELETYIAECTRIHAIRTQHVWSWLVEFGIPCAQPDGAFYLFPSFDRWRTALAGRGVHTSDDLAAYLLEHYQLATLPGTAFGVPAQELSLRLATSYLDMETDDDADAVLAAYRGDPTPAVLMNDHHPATQEALARLGEFVRAL